MKISGFLYLFLGIPFAYFAYYAFTNNGEHALWMVPFLAGIAATYVMSPHIEWMYSKRFPPKLPEKFLSQLESNNPYYSKLDKENKKEFNKRISLIALSKDMDTRPEHAIPFDVSHGLASTIATMTFYLEDFLLSDYEKIIIYKTSFPSPLYLKHIHACEVNHEDKVVLLATDKFMLGLNRPTQYLNTGYYVYGQIIKHLKAVSLEPEDGEAMIVELCKILGFKKNAVHKYIGLPQLDIFALASTVFFMRPEAFKEQLPALFDRIRLVYNYPA